MPKALFFDIDDTILDYDKCAVLTLQNACAALHVPYSEEALAEYRRVDDFLWAQQKLGRLTIPEVLDQRNRHMMDYWGLQGGLSFQEAFIAAFADSAELVDGVEDVLQSLREQGIPLYCASNGFLSVQVNRLQKAGVLHYFRELFVSDAIGYEKPDPRFFHHCLQQTGYAPEDVLMIGDSLVADIQGAQAAGWNVCYFNRKGKPCGLDCPQLSGWDTFALGDYLS